MGDATQEDPGQDQAPEVDETIELLTKGIARLGGDVRFQETARDLATKLAFAVGQVQEDEATAAD